MEVSFPRHPWNEFPEMLAASHESFPTAARKGNWNGGQTALTELFKHPMNERQPLFGRMLPWPAAQTEISRLPLDSPKERTTEAAGIGEGMYAANWPQS